MRVRPWLALAPLAEQALLVRGARGVESNAIPDPSLVERGVVCAACHVHAHERFGPLRRDGTVANPGTRERLPPDGVTRTGAFPRSEFCRSCHQFTPVEFKLNGTVLENTYEEWKASRYPRERACSARIATCPTAGTSGAASTIPTWCAMASRSRCRRRRRGRAGASRSRRRSRSVLRAWATRSRRT